MSKYVNVRDGYRCLLINYKSDRFQLTDVKRRLYDFQVSLMAKTDAIEENEFYDEEYLESFRKEFGVHDIPLTVKRRIDRRVDRYLELSRQSVGVDHLKPDDLKRLKPVSEKTYASYIDEDGADRLASDLHENFPWMSQATNEVWLQLRNCAKSGTPAHFGPLLLDGPPGIGKSAWSRSLSSMLSAPQTSIDAAAASAGFAVSGTERGFGTAQAGRPVELILQHAHGSPVIVVDEICKAPTVYTTKGSEHSISDALLGLLEPISASRYECPFFRVPFDLSCVSWILTSNYLDRVPEPLRTRCSIVQCSGLSKDHMMLVARRLSEKHGLSPAAHYAALEAVDRLSDTLSRPTDLRDVRRIIDRAEALQNRPVFH